MTKETDDEAIEVFGRTDYLGLEKDAIMAGDYLIQFKSPNSPLTEERFSNFTDLAWFINENKSPAWANSVSVHLPAQATDAERALLRKMSFESK